MKEERQLILQMLSDRQINVGEAEKLLDSLSGGTALDTRRAVKPKRLIVHVTDDTGRETVNVKIPFSIVKMGMKLGSKFGAMDNSGNNAARYLENIDFDEILAELASGEITLPYVITEVTDINNGTYVYVALE